MDFSKYDDLMLLQEIKEGDETAFRILFHKYSRFLKMEAYYRLQDMDISEEVINDVFSAIWISRLDIDIQVSFKPYLFKAVVNKCICRLRSMNSNKNRVHRGEEINIDLGFDPGIMENKELGQLIANAIAQIANPKSKRAFELQFIHNKSQKEIARIMNLSLVNVKKLVSRGLKIVRAFLRKHL